MSTSESVFQLYQRFYTQKKLLNGAPDLGIDINQIGMAEFPVDRALVELNALASYLTGHRDIGAIPFAERVQAVQKNYHNQPFWRELLLDYLELCLDIEDEKLAQKGTELHQKEQALMDQITDYENNVQNMIAHYANAVKQGKFHVDAERLIKTYFKMMRRDEDKAWEVLTSHPAYFSPIQTKDATGKVILTPSQAQAENDRLAAFLRTLKG